MFITEEAEAACLVQARGGVAWEEWVGAAVDDCPEYQRTWAVLAEKTRITIL